MKNLILSILAALLTLSVFAQAPQKVSYQAVIRNSSSALITSTTVGMQISILQGSALGTPVYVETQTPTSNINGLVSLEIGTGITIDNFSTIDWSNGSYFIKTETDPTGGTSYTITGTSELLSVPYALHAKTAENIIGGISETDPIFGVSVASGIIGTDITNWNNKLDTEIDGSVTNEIQALSMSNDTIYLSNGGFVKLPSANAWSLTGNTGTVDGVNFIGTTDNVPLNFKVNNEKAGRIDQYLFNSFYGYQAGNSNTTGVNNTASGYQSLFLNTTGHENVSVGNYSLYENTIGTANTALGYAAMNKNTSGGANTAIGYDALFYNTTGNENTATGRVALHFNTTGVWNTATGSVALMNNTTGNNNTTVGYGSLFSNTTGNNNTAIGWTAGNLNETGSGNVFIGYEAGFNETGSNKLYIANSSTITPLIYGDFATGNVGIGTTNLTEKLVVVGNIGSGQIATFDCQTCDDRLITLGQVITDNGGYVKYKKSSNYTGIGVHGHSEQLIVNGAGNVGIGTTSPTAKLQIETYGFSNKTIWGMNSMLIQNQTPGARTLLALAPNGTQNADLVIFHNSDYTTNYESLSLGYENTLNNFTIGTSKGGTGTQRRLVLDVTGAPTNLWKQLVLATSGNIGIGTLTPGAALEVQGNIKIVDGTQGVNKVLTSDANGLASWQTANSYTAGSGIEINGNVIKTNEPFYLGKDTLGGIVYYIYKGNDGLQHGLIINPSESTAQWQSSGTTTNANQSWDGVYNMGLMTGSPAKTYCQGLSTGGFTDWYLPSIDELVILSNNRFHANKALNAGSYTILSNTGYYWSSTELDASAAFLYTFLYSYSGFTNKTTSYSVRAVRAF